MAAIYRAITGVTLVGQVTGGCGGGNSGYQISNGRIMGISVSDFLDQDSKSIEAGVDPDVIVELGRRAGSRDR